ncbi:DHH family phosphoesterase [Halanaeroarchaeum sulfurireducens]|uniref:DHH family phosphoesterase n=1 Tax=Halanaeroarchaeum sulfurireducens TaxID=1604004 RepID=A0A0F7P9A3_9EURY|nr:DHH family phosphoesterase [Halanaeroarchaeum sulfurireducens]AKH97711.1 DHH family phosphoesterase [Halanaeroarchaeum sulfurireducens]ALG82106.1 DHH family phosphoesterase [Halanaeroarchaeum sulfurireducens]
MLHWLLLGSCGLSHDLLEQLDQRAGSLRIVEPDEAHVQQLRNDGIDAETGDVTDRETITTVEMEPNIVVVAGDAIAQNVRATTLARETFPDSYVIAFPGEGATRSDVAELDERADRMFDMGREIIDHMSDVVRAGQVDRLRHLNATLADIDGTLGIFTHDNPDPDAIASAFALAEIARHHGVEAQPAYFGRISHQENRALVNLLDLKLDNPDPDEEHGYDAIALVDHSTPGVNDQLARETTIDIVIDHHPSRHTVEGGFVDVRESAGATSTLLVDYLRGYHIDIEDTVATALLYGIRVDTNDFARGITPADFDAAAFLLPYADVEILKRVESPSISSDTFEIIARAIRNRDRRGRVLTSCVGSVSDRDALAQSANRLLNMEGIDVTLVYGYRDGTIFASGRARGVEMDLGEVLRKAFDSIGSAGGHAEMAGAQISLGLFEDVTADEELTTMVEDVVTTRFFDEIDPDALG